MKCLYYLAPGVDSAQRISDDLHSVGIDDFFLHVIVKDESGLKKRQIHSGNYLETLDFVREGLLGADLGFVACLLARAPLDRLGAFWKKLKVLEHYMHINNISNKKSACFWIHVNLIIHQFIFQRIM